MPKAKGIIQTRRECYLCRILAGLSTTQNLELHHVFPGSRRQLSDKTGLVVYLCHEHHTGSSGVHQRKTAAYKVMWDAQDAYEKLYGHEDFMKKFGKDYKALETRLEAEDYR